MIEFTSDSLKAFSSASFKAWTDVFPPAASAIKLSLHNKSKMKLGIVRKYLRLYNVSL